MNSKLISILIANLFAVSGAGAQDAGGGLKLSGSVGIGGRSTSISATDKSKAEEY